MRIRVLLPIIVTCLILALTYHFIAIAAIDAPHNDSTRVLCGKCHGEGLLQSFWGGSGIYSTVDELCISCHTQLSCPLTHDTIGPQAITHKDSNDIVLAECITCHDPHYQKQKNYKNTDWNNLYLAHDGKITSYEYNHPDDYNPDGEDPDGNGKTYSDIELSHTSVLHYDPFKSITYKDGWNATRLTRKTWECRGAILFPNVKKLGFSYPIIAIDEFWKTITVKGDVTPVYQYISTSEFAVMYGQFIKDNINGNPVKFFCPETFADGDTTYNGICEVCHTPQDAHHFAGARCTDCHNHSGGFKPSNDCIGCHSYSIRGRAAITKQFNANSHHVQGVTLENTHCYECHWEAKADGTINNPYHEGYDNDINNSISGAKVDLVIYSAGSRPEPPDETYAVGTTAIQYTADGSRGEIEKLNAHCLSCHNEQNSTTTPIYPFGDGKTPKQYAWDSSSIDARYSQTGTTAWGKYGGAKKAAKQITKAYSAHGNATANQGGWDPSSGVDEIIPNTRNGSVNVGCFDCHNSHGSSVEGPTTSYTSATTYGGILKDTEENKGGYTINYKPTESGSSYNKNIYHAGAALCFDCHLTNWVFWDVNTPWGYNVPFGATEPIMGYFDTPYFGTGTSGPQQRYSYKTGPQIPWKTFITHQGGHFGASSPLSTMVDGSINGLCTPCHDPHGVSTTINQEYAVPLLKGKWMTSPYKEDASPNITDEVRYGHTVNEDCVYNGGSPPGYHIDQNTFANYNYESSSGISENTGTFGNLCLGCHKKEYIDADADSSWKGMDRIHETVKGWGANNKHSFPCSKCHTPHNSRLPRLMVTNCLDYKHRGRVTAKGWPGSFNCSGSDIRCGGFVVWGAGSGRFPAGGEGGKEGTTILHEYYFGANKCHEDPNPVEWPERERWNAVTVWNYPLAVSVAAVDLDLQATITWTMHTPGTSCVDYGLMPLSDNPPNYSTTCYDPWVREHNVIITGLINHETHYYRVRSNQGGTEVFSATDTFKPSVPPTVPTLIDAPDNLCDVPEAECPVRLEWNPSTNPGDGGTIEYKVKVDNNKNMDSPEHTSDWITETFWDTPAIPNDGTTWWWTVRARDADETTSKSDWVDVPDSFRVIPFDDEEPFLPPSRPFHIPEPDLDQVCKFSCPVEFNWNASNNPSGRNVEYRIQVDYSFACGNCDRYYDSDWVDGMLSKVVGLRTDITTPWVPETVTWFWRVAARDIVTGETSGWTELDSFTIVPAQPPTIPVLIQETDNICPDPLCTVTLEWYRSSMPGGGTLKYQVLVDDNADWGNPDYDSNLISEDDCCTGDQCSWDVSIRPNNNTIWFWKVKAVESELLFPFESDWSTVDSFQVKLPPGSPPLTPIMIPEDDFDSGGTTTQITLEWYPEEDPDGHSVQYQVQVDDSTDFLDVYDDSGWISDESYNVTVDPCTEWYWRIRAKDVFDGVESPWSSNDFFIDISSECDAYFTPTVPVLSPEPHNLCPFWCYVILDWEQSTSEGLGPIEYQVQVDDSFDFSSVTYDSNWISELSYQFTNIGIHKWYWRVRAKDPNHAGAISDWSDTDSFYVAPENSPPLAPILIPQDDFYSDGSDVLITLEWYPEEDPDGHSVQYQVQVDDSTDFLDVYDDSGWMPDASYDITVGPGTEWYWRVRARDESDLAESGWSDMGSFTVYVPIINESFEKNEVIDGTGYDEAWNPIEGVGCILNPDYDISLLQDTPPPGSGSECLQSTSDTPDFKAFAKQNYGSEQPNTSTSFYLYVEDGLSVGNKRIAVLLDGPGNEVVSFRLTSDPLQLNFKVYNDGVSNSYYYPIDTDTWYKIRVKYDNNHDVYEWWVNDVSQGSDTLKGTEGTDYYPGIQKWWMGFKQTTQTITGTIYYDVVIVNSVY